MHALLALSLALLAAAQAVAAPQPAPAAPTDRDRALARESAFRFAPVPLPLQEFDDDRVTPVAIADYSEIWTPEAQRDLGITANQRDALLAINTRGVEESLRHSEEFKRLPEAERNAQAASWGDGPAPWRREFETRVRQELEAVLTPEQVAELRANESPRRVLGKLFDAEVRDQIGFDLEQQSRLRAVLEDRLAQLQAEQLQLADDVWDSTTPDQRAQFPGLVRRQGPTSAVLSLAHALGFDYDTMSASYPMLSMRPMRDRLELTPDQQAALDKLREQTAARRRAAPGQPIDDNDRAAIEAILTAEQLAQLTEANFRRQVVLALNYPEKRAEVGVTPDQLAAWETLADKARTRLHAVDRLMLADVLEIVTPDQREQLVKLIEQDGRP